jgi:phage tail-like protein
MALAGLAVTEDHYLLVGSLDPPGLLCFDLVAGGEPSLLHWPLPDFAPYDVCRRAGGGAWVLDAGQRLVWELGRDWRIAGSGAPAPTEVGGFAPEEDEAAAAETGASGTGASGTGASAVGRASVSAADAFPLDGEPLAIAPLGDGVLVLEHHDPDEPSRLVLLRRGRLPVAAVAQGRGTTVRGHDLAVADAEPPVAYVADERGNQAFAFALDASSGGLSADLLPQYLPLRRFGGKALVAAPGGVRYDLGEGWIPLVCQPQARHAESAIVVTPILDGGEPGCVWHRLLLDGRLDPGASVEVFSAAADDPAALAVPQWRPEPAPRARAGGIETPFAGDLAGYDTLELLFQRARGRHLRVKLVLGGDGRATPRLRALRASFPRFSYLERYLPAVFREDEQSASFLDRFLANLEGFATSVEDTIAAAHVLLDPSATPSEALDWLAGWFDATLDPAWDDARRRLFVTHAAGLFRRRGTPAGIELALRLALDGCLDERDVAEGPAPSPRQARVVEAFRARRTPGVLWGDPTDLGGPRTVEREAWTPVQGGVALDAAYRAYLERAGVPRGARQRFPLARPAGRAGEAWQRFAERTLGFVPPAAGDGVVERAWRRFLARRYSSPSALSDAYGLLGDDRIEAWEDVDPPATLPPDGTPLLDWFAFSTVVLPMRRRAHRFTVLLPVPLGGDAGGADEVRRRAERVVELQKPAHTLFELRFFWAAFRVGEARLGTDTHIEAGSRAPELLTPLVLGRRHLGETHLAGAPAEDAVRRPFPSTHDDPEPA